jgi:putative N6-adenine-specific DNA methylase
LAQENAARAGVEKSILFDCQTLSSITPPNGPGWVVTNHPYWLRVSQGRDLRNFYAQLGTVLCARCPGCIVAISSSEPILLRHFDLKLDLSFSMVNGDLSLYLAKDLVA